MKTPRPRAVQMDYFGTSGLLLKADFVALRSVMGELRFGKSGVLRMRLFVPLLRDSNGTPLFIDRGFTAN